MDLNRIEESYTQFRDTAQQAFQLIDGLIGKMQTASQNGDPQAGEWARQLQDISSMFQNGQGHAGDLMQQLVGVVGALNGKGSTEGEDSSASNAISSLLNSDLGKSLEEGALQKIGSGFLGRFFK